MGAGLPGDAPLLKASAATRPKAGIVHLGLGAFFRAHGAIYTAEAMAKSGGDWGIIGVSLRHPTQRDLLQPQGFAYTAVELAADGETPQVVEVLQNVLVAREDPLAVLSAMADPAIRIVSLTVTEKGYCHLPSTGLLNRDHPDVVHDLAHDLPRSAPGYLVRALQMRRAAGLAPFTVLCCDNLPENGVMLRGIVLELARLVDPGLTDWIALNGAFPSTMVDRIVPALKPENIAELAEKTGVTDRAPVMHEPFRQWVIEDWFVGDARPDYAAVGADMVRDVRPFEHMKLRCLNGTHSALAYLGYLAGHQTIFDTISDPAFATYCRRLWQSEITPGLDAPQGVDLAEYTGKLFQRYGNPAIRHLTHQIAMDGSQKLPPRILATISENLKAGRDSSGLILAVAAWMRYVGATDENGQPIKVQDPLAARLKTLSDKAGSVTEKVGSILALREVFPANLAENPEFQKAVVASYTNLARRGAGSCVLEYGS
ncbi:MAG: mannitol dehydrogenase family protein [Rhodobacteraceae bacterium]|nr:mannitol dehydrogenase family protein [Paracoccaceae bacterium]